MSTAVIVVLLAGIFIIALVLLLRGGGKGVLGIRQWNQRMQALRTLASTDDLVNHDRSFVNVRPIAEPDRIIWEAPPPRTRMASGNGYFELGEDPVRVTETTPQFSREGLSRDGAVDSYCPAQPRRAGGLPRYGRVRRPQLPVPASAPRRRV